NDLIRPAQLVFINFARNLVGSAAGYTDLLDAIRQAQKTTPDNENGQRSFYAMDRKTHEYIAGPEVTRKALADSLPQGMELKDVLVGVVPKGLFLAYQETPEFQTRENSPMVRTWFVFQNNPALRGADVTEARSTLDTGAGGN